VIDTGCIGSYKSNYHTITATTSPWDLIIIIKKLYSLLKSRKKQIRCRFYVFVYNTIFSTSFFLFFNLLIQRSISSCVILKLISSFRRLACICQNRKIKKKYVDCLTYKNIVWPLFSYENQSNANSKIISEKKYRVKGIYLVYRSWRYLRKVIQETRTQFDIYVFIASFITFSLTTLYVKILENRVNVLWALR
jgi:hypothetical protein